MSEDGATIEAAKQLADGAYCGVVAATAKSDDEVGELSRLGSDAACDSWREAGAGFTQHVCVTGNSELKAKSR